jgi:putative nucleotidyltransferase with HDIG domain
MGTAIIPQTQDTAAGKEPSSFLMSFRRALPVFATTLFQMNAILSSSPVNLARLMVVAGDDPAMTANLLREAASADRDVVCDQLLDAIIGVGIRRLQAMMLRTPLMTGAEAHSTAYMAWRNHSALAAVLAESLARQSEALVPARARICGLLHDIGKLPLLLRNVGDGCAEPARSDDPVPDDAGNSHGEIGHELAQAWGFSSALCDCIRQHHAGQTEMGESLLAVVTAADRVCHRCGVTMDVEMTGIYRELPLEEILAGALSWLSAEQAQAAADHVRRAYETWQRSHPSARCVSL